MGSSLQKWILTSLAVHVAAAAAVGVLGRARFHPPEKLEIIPVQLISMPAPPAKQVEPTPPPPRPQEEVIPDPLEKVKPKEKEPPIKPPEPTVKPIEKKPEPPQETPKKKEGPVKPTPTPVVSERPSIDQEIPVEVEFEGPPFEYAWYITALRQKIAANWDVPEARADGTATRVRFRVERNGKVVDAEVLESSGDPIFDNSALRALLKASPMPPLPGKYPQDWLGVRLQFIYRQ